MNKNLAYLAGVLRDGSVYFHKKFNLPRVSIVSNNKEFLITIIRKIFQEEFGSHGTLTENIPKNFRLEVRKKNIFDFCVNELEFVVGNQSFWSTPTAIKNSDIEIQREYIKGFFDAEGTVIIYDKLYDCCIRIYQSWNKFGACPPLEDIKEILKSLNIHCTLAYANKPHGKTNKIPNYALIIRKKESIKKFIELIGSSHPDKLKKLLVLNKKIKFAGD